MTEIPDDILDRATQTFHKSLREHEDYATAVADALSIAAPLFAVHELRNLAGDLDTDGYELPFLRDRANELEAGAS